MALNRIQAARLLTDREMTLFEASLAENAAQANDKELQSQIRRVRTQRDKYQDLFQRQRVSTRQRTGSKAGASGVANARTQQKAQAFSEALARLEKQQQRRERASAPADKPASSTARRSASGRPPSRRTAAAERPSARRSEAPAKGAARARRAGPSASGQAAPAVAQAKRMQAMGSQRPLAHVASRNRRQQARRDAR
jgi:hypothetical protein